MSPEEYLDRSITQRNNIKILTNEFKNELKVKSGKCMDVGCGPGNSTFELLLPALHPNATLMGKHLNKHLRTTKSLNYMFNDKHYCDCASCRYRH